MTTYTMNGFVATEGAGGDFAQIAPASIVVVVPDSTIGFSYDVIGSNDLGVSLVDISVEDYNVRVIGASIDFSNPDLETNVVAVSWNGGANTAYVLGFFDNVSSQQLVIQIGGDSLPSFANVAAFNLFLSGASFAEAGAGSGFAAGDTILFSTLLTQPNIISTEADTIVGSADDDVFDGGAGNDTISGLGGNDRLSGDDGDDTLSGGLGRDTLNGGAGNDVLRTGGGNDTARGGNGRDRILGEAGDDRLFGQGGNDRMDGGKGNDLLNGGVGNDRMTGGGGRDTFIFVTGEAGDDLITDFDAARDILAIDLGGLGRASVAVSNDGTDTVVTYGNGANTITLDGVALARADITFEFI